MNREILFRGKSLSNGEWVYGFYTQGNFIDPNTGKETVRHIIDNELLHDVDIDTVGQFTGLIDRKDVKIYDGDIIFVEFADKSGGYRLVGWNEKTASWGIMDAYSYQSLQGGYDFAEFKNYVLMAYLKDAIIFEVVGNIYDNPEFLSIK